MKRGYLEVEPGLRALSLSSYPIRYGYNCHHPESFSVDRALPVMSHPELADHPLNFRPSYVVSNHMRGDDEPHIDLSVPSEMW